MTDYGPQHRKCTEFDQCQQAFYVPRLRWHAGQFCPGKRVFNVLDNSIICVPNPLPVGNLRGFRAPNTADWVPRDYAH